MNRVLLASLAASLLLLACPKNDPGPSLGGTDDQKMDALASQLEEYRTRTKTDSPCDETCATQVKICNLSQTACEVAGRNADRQEFQQRCVTAQEECARFNEACSACKK